LGFHIFFNYRREVTAGHAYRLHDFLVAGTDERPGFSDDQIFMDIDTIRPGDDFRKVIAEAVAECDVFLAVIGRRWTRLEDQKGRPRLANANDFVRLEIEAALKREIPVVPVLVDGAEMPDESELPKSIADLAYRNAVELSDTRWQYDVGRLLASLKKRENEKVRADPPRTRRTAQRAGSANSEDATSPTTQPSKRKTVRKKSAPERSPQQQQPSPATGSPDDSVATGVGGPLLPSSLRLSKYRVGALYHGRVESIEGMRLEDQRAKVLIGPETYGKLPGEKYLKRERRKTYIQKLETESGDLVGIGDTITVKIESVNPYRKRKENRIVLSFVETMPEGWPVGPAT
jgi:hypothetical protein